MLYPNYKVLNTNKYLDAVSRWNNLDNVNINLDRDEELKKRVGALLGYYGLKHGTELVRILVNEKYKEIMK